MLDMDLPQMSSLSSRDFVDAFARGLAVLEVFAGGRVSLSVSQVAEATNMSRAAARRLLLTLRQLGYTDEQRGVFSLTPRVTRLGHAFLRSHVLATLGQYYSAEVAKSSNETSTVAILDDLEALSVSHSAIQRVFILNMSTGNRVPAWATANGRVLLGSLDDEELRERLQRSTIENLTPFTQTNRDEVFRIVCEGRQKGYCVVEQELEVGLSAVAVPIFDQGGRVVASINMAGRTERISMEKNLDIHLKILREAAGKLSGIS